jgi:hypothetical protein
MTAKQSMLNGKIFVFDGERFDGEHDAMMISDQDDRITANETL